VKREKILKRQPEGIRRGCVARDEGNDVGVMRLNRAGRRRNVRWRWRTRASDRVQHRTPESEVWVNPIPLVGYHGEAGTRRDHRYRGVIPRLRDKRE